MTKPSTVEIKDGRVDWMYPDIYAGENPRSVLRIGLYHVRAADDIEIEYDGERDGYVIYRTVTTGHVEYSVGCYEPIEKRKELAFIPAWDEEEAEDL